MNNLFISNSKKQKAKKLFLFCASFLLCYYIIFYLLINVFTYKNKPLLASIQPNSKYAFYRTIYERSFADFPYGNLDYIFLGSSHCYKGFDPAIFEKHNIKTYNLGNSSQSPLNSYFLLKKYMDYSDKFILEVYPVTFASSGYEAFKDIYVASNDYWLLTQMAFSINDAQAIQSLAFKPFVKAALKNKSLNDSFFYKGYAFTEDSVNKKSLKYDTLSLNIEKINTQFSYIQKMAELCAQYNKELILVYAPVPKEAVFLNESYCAQKIAALSQKFSLKYFNYGRNHSLNSNENFYDKDHLNQSGVRIFNEDLIKKLNATP